MNTINYSQDRPISEANQKEPQKEKETTGQPSNECIDLAGASSILSVLSNTLENSGYAGPTHIPELVFLTLYTRIDKPGSLAIKGPSSSGKSFALKSALKFIPDTAYEQFHGMSEKALLYLKLNLKNRILVIQEAAGLSEGVGRAFLRQLLSEGEVRYATVSSTDKGLVGLEPRIEGPTGLIVTTTANGLHLEDETRLLSIRVDESPEQIKAALRAQAAGANRPITHDDVRPWHELHDYICNCNIEVSVPYVAALAECMPNSHNRVTRDFPQVLALIRAHARLHLVTRRRDSEGKIVATMEDYSAVHRLTADALAQGLEASAPPHVKEIVEAVAKLSGANNKERSSSALVTPISQRQLAEHLKRDRSVISRNVRTAINAGYLADSNFGQGRESRLELGERPMPSGQVLPTPEELADAIRPKGIPVVSQRTNNAPSSTVRMPF